MHLSNNSSVIDVPQSPFKNEPSTVTCQGAEANSSSRGWKLRIVDLDIFRGETLLLRGISLCGTSGSILRLTGKNGSGKTTLLRYIAGFNLLHRHKQSPSSAGIFFSHNNHPADISLSTAWIGHEKGLKPTETVLTGLRFWLDALEVSAELPYSEDKTSANAAEPLAGQARADKLDTIARRELKKWGLDHACDAPTSYLSHGQQQRAALARLTATTRPLWLLDEPDTALDTSGIKTLAGAMLDHAHRGGVTVYSSHSNHLPLTSNIDLEHYVPDKPSLDSW